MLHLLELLAQCMLMVLIIPALSISLLIICGTALFLVTKVLTKIKRVLY